MQSFLFNEAESQPTETLDEVNQELLEKAKAIPTLQSRMFVFGENESQILHCVSSSLDCFAGD